MIWKRSLTRHGWAVAHLDPHPSVSLRRFYVDEFHRDRMSRLPTGSQVLDLGGHRDTKRGQFDIRQYPLDVVCVNLVPDRGADIIADAADLPISDATFDVVVCAELLEHVRDPTTVLSEAFRVLRPGGRLLLCAPFLFHIHGDPHDYGRYTPQYWQETLAQTGFEAIDVLPQGRFWSVLCDMVRHVAQHRLTRRGRGGRLLRAVCRPLLSWAKRQAVLWDARPLPAHDVVYRFTTGFGIEALKPREINHASSC